MLSIMVPRQASLQVALLVELFVIWFRLLLAKQFDGFSVSLGGLRKVLFSLMAVTDAQVPTE